METTVICCWLVLDTCSKAQTLQQEWDPFRVCFDDALKPLKAIATGKQFSRLQTETVLRPLMVIQRLKNL